MKDVVTGLCVLLMVLASGSAAVADSKARAATQTYFVADDEPTVMPSGTGSGAKFAAFVTFRSRTRDSSVDVRVTDETGLDVAADLLQDLDGDREYEISSSFCGRSDRAIPIIGGHDVVIALRDGPCTTTSAVPLRGTITLRFHRDWPGH